ncbi:MAG: histidine--tRNA ligase, partial [Pelolinea sp.]|nr:histidine--tRNA ligase [Pelolinea sp.]
QSFVFPDRGGNLITLRPELTPSLARMVAQKQRQLIYPLRWWSFGPFWRYEKPQKGRTREFFQWNIDLIGADTPEADAELIAICAEFFKQIGLTAEKVKIFVNDRQLMDKKLSEIGIDDSLKKKAFNVIDRKDKLNDESWKKYGLESGITEEQFDGLSALLSSKDLYLESPSLKKVFSALESLGVDAYVQYDPMIVRGLDYYTGVVFEARDIGKKDRAILGGGRYDNLVNDVGGDPLTGIGFAMGDVVLPIILEDYGLLPSLKINPAQILVTIFDEESTSKSLKIAAELRNADFSVQLFPETAKIGKQFKFADRSDIQYAVVIGPEEIEGGFVQVKDMKTREQVSVMDVELISYFKGLLAE